MGSLTAEQIFTRFVWPLYPADVQADLSLARRVDANPAGNRAILGHLDDAARVFVAMAPALFGGRDPRLDRSDASVHRLSVLLTAERRDAWATRGEPGTADNELFNVIVHAALYVGACAVAQHGGRWGVRRPLWESVVSLESPAGVADLAVLQWIVKSLADPEPGAPAATLADRYRTHVEVPCFDASALAVIVAAEGRRIPRLAKVRYASLHQHLRAHVPELRDLGEDFPSAERLEDMQLEWLDVLVVGGGRMVVLFGPSRGGGTHLVWLTAAGFAKSAYFPSDSFPAPILRVEGEKLVLLLSVDEKRVVEEMLWWGP
jgi:hypothetical protein